MDKKALIARTLEQMLQTRPLDKITVTDLVEACGVSRQTFYYHFQELLDAVEWQLRQSMDQALSAGLASPPASLPEAFRAMVQVTWEHREAIRQTMASQRRAELERLFLQMSRDLLLKLYRARRSDSPVRPADLEFSLSFASCGMVGVLLETVTEKSPDLDNLVRQMDRVLSQMP